MTDEIKTGGPAFPWCGDLNDTPHIGLGMTLHDYFSAKAMAAIISNPSLIDDLGQLHVDWVISHSRAVADAMIKARG
ncbi:hypothetical protein DVP62_17395 [Yersinia enterocolitica]|nr:hypothetical protein [Yersinia enterocolitica]EKN6262890.1 hypothetical protein [Yersinia enterocolitica]HDL7128104.1 hypothetical protein [Yersinia enterocolitica]HDL7946544.1 hypothetical protein [Yersinia enterocolitica]HDM8431777.1 hypothetical protein [Yersinia enterocolitica]